MKLFNKIKKKLGSLSRSHSQRFLPHLSRSEESFASGSTAHSSGASYKSATLATKVIEIEEHETRSESTISVDYQKEVDLEYHLKLKYFLKVRDMNTANNMVADSRLWLENFCKDATPMDKYIMATKAITESFKIDRAEVNFRKTMKEEWVKLYKHNNMCNGVLGKQWFEERPYNFIERRFKGDKTLPIFTTVGI